MNEDGASVAATGATANIKLRFSSTGVLGEGVRFSLTDGTATVSQQFPIDSKDFEEQFELDTSSLDFSTSYTATLSLVQLSDADVSGISASATINTFEVELDAIAPPANGCDCDDDNPAAYPGAEDSVGDGVDQNCDGVDGEAANRH